MHRYRSKSQSRIGNLIKHLRWSVLRNSGSVLNVWQGSQDASDSKSASWD